MVNAPFVFQQSDIIAPVAVPAEKTSAAAPIVVAAASEKTAAAAKVTPTGKSGGDSAY